jgi:hypothetical protein
MRPTVLLLPLFVACETNTGIVEIEGEGEGEGELVEEEPDYSEYDGATLRIVEPASGAFLALEETHTFTAALRGADGAEMAYDDIAWSSSSDTEWAHVGGAFEDNALDVGIHDLTAEVELPNGDRLAHTVGGVLVQSMYAGTYAGLFSANVTYDVYTVTCSGAALLVVDPYGKNATGTANCLIALQGYEIEAAYLFDLDNNAGQLTGTASADFGGFFEYPFDATGTLNPETDTLELTFGGDFFGMMTIDASVGTERVSLDSEPLPE